MGYETYNLIVVDYTDLLVDTTLSATAPLSITIPLKTNVGTSITNTFSTP